MHRMQVGCGAGNTVYPALEVNPELTVYACDFSPRAVEIVKAHPDYASGAWYCMPAPKFVVKCLYSVYPT